MKSEIEHFFEMVAARHSDISRVVFVCIGSDRSTGDSFGPLAGTMLKESGWPNVIGTLEEPCDAHAVERKLQTLDDSSLVIAIDACLGKPASVGKFIVKEGALQPGKAIGRNLPSVGHYSVAGVVNTNGPKAYWMLQTTSLYQVLQMAKVTAQAINSAWNRNTEKRVTQSSCESQIPAI